MLAAGEQRLSVFFFSFFFVLRDSCRYAFTCGNSFAFFFNHFLTINIINPRACVFIRSYSYNPCTWYTSSNRRLCFYLASSFGSPRRHPPFPVYSYLPTCLRVFKSYTWYGIFIVFDSVFVASVVSSCQFPRTYCHAFPCLSRSLLSLFSCFFLFFFELISRSYFSQLELSVRSLPRHARCRFDNVVYRGALCIYTFFSFFFQTYFPIREFFWSLSCPVLCETTGLQYSYIVLIVDIRRLCS